MANPATFIISAFSGAISKCISPGDPQSATQLLHGKMHRYTAKIIHRTDIPKKDGRCELALQAFINTKRKVIGLDIFLLPEEFNKDDQRIIYIKNKSLQKKKEAYDFNLVLGKKLSKASDIFMHHRIIDVPLDVHEFTRQFNESTLRLNFYTFWEKEVASIKHDRTKHTVLNYNNTLNWLKAYMPVVEIHQVNYDYIAGFDRFMRSGKNKAHINTVWRHHRNIKFIINQGIRKKVFSESSYKNFKPRTVHTERDFLNQDQLQALLNLYYSNELKPVLQRSLRMFLFSCFTGLRISDVFGITSDMISDNTLVFPMKKGMRYGKYCKVPLNETAKKFIENNYGQMFDKVAEKQVNLDLKEINTKAKIEFKKLSFHIGRHTFAVQFLLSGGNIQELQKILGHSNINTTMIYVHITESMKRESVLKMDGRFKSEPGNVSMLDS